MKSNLGLILKYIRVSRGTTMVFVAEKAGITRLTLDKIEKGITTIRYESILNVAEVLDIKMSKIFTVYEILENKGIELNEMNYIDILSRIW